MLLRRPALTLACAAALLLAPSLMLGTLQSQSAPQNLTWAAQFADQFRAGILYPRWMPDSFDGLGGPAFYFYPPLAFWLDGVVSLVTFNLLSVSHRLTLDGWLLLWASGLAMHAWLSTETGRARVALWGALAYMAAPYHLLVDHYIRGAFAEGAAYAFVPLVMLGIRQMTDRRRHALLVLALSYGGLLLSHLPTALLVSTTVLPAYAIFRTRDAAMLLRLAASGILGIGLAAIYLWPAATLQGWISADLLWTRFYRVDNWFLVAPGRWPEPILMQIVASITAAALILAVGLCVFARRRAEALFWAAASVVCIALLAGLVPWFWQLPELAKVQFPWRLLLAVEFALITALCLAPLAPLGRGKVYLGTASIVALAAGRHPYHWRRRRGRLVGGEPCRGRGAGREGIRAARLSDRARPHLRRVGPRAGEGRAAGLVRACGSGLPGDARTLRSDAARHRKPRANPRDRPALLFSGLADRRRGIALEPTEKYRLVSFTAPAGRTTVQLQRAALTEEKWGWADLGRLAAASSGDGGFTARSSSREES